MEKTWDEVKRRLQARIPAQPYKIWIEPLRFLGYAEETMALGCPNKFFVNWIRDNYLSTLIRETRELASSNVDITLEVERTRDANTVLVVEERQLELPSLTTPAFRIPRFNPAFTFDQFVTGRNNHFAFSAAREVARENGSNHDFVYLLAQPGLGKSHLCQAIGTEVLDQNGSRRLLYLTIEDFINEMVRCLKNKQMDVFKDKYRKACDVLLLEEVHYLGGKEKTQDELAFTLDSLLSMKKKVVLTSSKLPREIRNLQGGLRSRLSSSLIVKIDPPDFETRVNILERKAKAFKIPVSKEIIEFLSEHIRDDVRQLESSLICLNARSTMGGVPLNMDLAREVVRGFVEHKKHLTMQEIQEFVANQFKLDVDDIRSKSRKANVVLSRSIAMHLCRKYTEHTLESVGRAFSRNHTSVLYALSSLEKKMRQNQKTKDQVRLLEGRIERMLFSCAPSPRPEIRRD
jgi:chromosomal replication initiator protein